MVGETEKNKKARDLKMLKDAMEDARKNPGFKFENVDVEFCLSFDVINNNQFYFTYTTNDTNSAIYIVDTSYIIKNIFN